MDRKKKWSWQLDNQSILFSLLICLAGAIIYILIYGIQSLNPTYIDWLLNGGDCTQHYLGSVAFRQSKWMFPLGMMDTLTYPEPASVIFTDSVPIVAIFFKLMRFWFHPTWQYQGLWGLSCFILQAYFASRLLRAFTKNKIIIFEGSLLFTISPVMIFRLYGHETLGAQWIILLALLLPVEYNQKYSNIKKGLLLTGILGLLAPAVHMYFLLMCGVVVAGYGLYDWMKSKQIWRMLLIIAIYIIAALISILVLGGFGQGNVTADGLGGYAFDLNSFTNPMGQSDFVKERASSSQEGFAYLGLAPLVLIVLAFIRLLSLNKEERKYIDWRLIISLGVIGLASLVLAQSPVIHYGANLLYVMDLPDWAWQAWSVFRASGRLIWPFYYILLGFGIIGNSLHTKERQAVLLLLFCLIFQWREMQPLYSRRNMNNITYQSGLHDEAWSKLIETTGSEHLYLIGDVDNGILCPAEYQLGAMALSEGLTMNRFWMVHEIYNQTYLKYVDTQNPSDIIGNLYVFFPEQNYDAYPNLIFYQLDGYIVGVPEDADQPDLPRTEIL